MKKRDNSIFQLSRKEDLDLKNALKRNKLNKKVLANSHMTGIVPFTWYL